MIDSSVIENIKENISGEVLPSEPLSAHTTYRTGGEAELLIIAADGNDAKWVYRFALDNGHRLTVIGAGSNIIVPDEGMEGIVLKTKSEGARIDFSGNGKAIVDAGVYLDSLIRSAAQENLGGFEHITGIPGTVGGAVVMNAGTNDGEVSAIIDSVEAVTPGGELLNLSPSDMGFGYRTSIFQGNDWLITNAAFNLVEVDGAAALKNIDRIWKERGKLYPMQFPNAGSVFRNPEGSHAGYLIEEAGLKGLKVGGAEVSEKHGNFIINTGNATSSDIIGLIELVREKVREKFGITLALEQKILSTTIDQ